jgi:hypothetical protein
MLRCRGHPKPCLAERGVIVSVFGGMKVALCRDGASHADGVRLREEPFARWYAGTF